MKLIHRFAIGIAVVVVLVGVGGVSTVAAHDDANPNHPACTGDKDQISSEGSDVGGDTAGSKYFTKPVCSGEQGKPHHHSHEPDDILSVPEGADEDCRETNRERSPNFEDDSC